jgi:ribosomal-protein-alanine N-acetyltransferase
LPLSILPLRFEDILEIDDIEREAFPAPWPPSAFLYEIENKLARYFVLRERRESGEPGMVLGYAGVWVVIDEAHLTTIAVRDTERGKGYGEVLLIHALHRGIEMGAITMTLEVREKNPVAQHMYLKYGFEMVGRRKNYYPEVHEDALIMTTDALDGEAFKQRFAAHERAIRDRLGDVVTEAG